MSDSKKLSRLRMVSLRQAWPHEAHDFTPWLAENIGLVSEAIGIPLEVEGTEVSVETFSADILARNPLDDSVVLIENQLESSDHAHLGQIMTYLSGLDAETVVWVADGFREPHIAAIRWLNENTCERFAFFAIQVRVAQIADSPLAPLFEVVERPNNWERAMHRKALGSPESSKRSEDRYQFWSEYVESVPNVLERFGPARRTANHWCKLEDLGFIISLYIGVDSAGLFIRGLPRADSEEVRSRLEIHAQELEAALGCSMGNSSKGHFFVQTRSGGYADKGIRPELVEWLSSRATKSEAALRSVFA